MRASMLVLLTKFLLNHMCKFLFPEWRLISRAKVKILKLFTNLCLKKHPHFYKPRVPQFSGQTLGQVLRVNIHL